MPADLPPTDHGFIVDDLFEIGPVEAIGMGTGPISWQAIDAWQRQTRRNFPPWRLKLIRRLSREYADESSHGDDRSRPAPWQQQPTTEQLEANWKARRAILMAAAGQ